MGLLSEQQLLPHGHRASARPSSYCILWALGGENLDQSNKVARAEYAQQVFEPSQLCLWAV